MTSRVEKKYDINTSGSIKKILAGVKFMQNFMLILSKIEHCCGFALFLVTFITIGILSAWQARLTPLLPPGLRKKEPSLPFFC